MSTRLGLGVIGIGRRWPRWRRALAALRDRFAVRAVCDQRPVRAERAARQLGATVAGGVVELLGRDDVNAVLMLARQWYGLWPLTQACQFKKPVLCTVPLATDDARADELVQQVREAALPVLMADPVATAPAVERLGELLAGELGRPRVVRVGRRVGGNLPRPGAALPGLVNLVAELFGAEPGQVWAAAAPSAVSVQLASDRGVAQLSVWAADGGAASCRIDVEAERGRAVATLPGRLRWRVGDVWHVQRLRGALAEERLLTRFREALDRSQTPRPGIAEAHRALRLLRAVRAASTDGPAPLPSRTP